MPLVRRERLIPNAPTLFLLHGWGSSADDLFSLAGSLPLPLSVVSLQGRDRHPGGEGYSWFEIGMSLGGEVRLDTEGARGVAGDLAAEFEAYPRPWTVLGFSQGAMMAGLLLGERPEAVDAGVMIAGLALPGLVVASGPRRRALVTHGRGDEVVPFAAGEDLARRLGEVHDVRFAPADGGHWVEPSQVQEILSFFVR